MKMHLLQHNSFTTVPALLSLALMLAASGATSGAAAEFPHPVAFDLGQSQFLPGDSITIQRVTGTSPTIRTGETYCVEGTYALASSEKADLALFATTLSAVATPINPNQTVRIEKGSGTFRLVKTMQEPGYLHLSFYPVPSGSSFGELYFGQGNWVLRRDGRGKRQASPRSPNESTSGNSSGRPVSATGPNQTLLEYLGDPVEPPADMSPAYTKDGLIKAVQTAARNAGITLKRIEIDDSEYPFLVGVICAEGDYPKLKDQLRKLEGYSYSGSVGGDTHNAMNIVPYQVYPPALFDRITHRTGLRMQLLHHKLTQLE